MPITTFPIIDVKTPPAINVFYLDSGIAIFGVPSNPETIVAAFPGSFAIDVAGNWYRKTTGTGNTGWVAISAVGSIANVLRRIARNTTPIGNVGAGLDPLHSFTIDTPNRLLVDGDDIEAVFGGLLAANDNNKRFVIQIDGQTIFDCGLLDFDGAVGRDMWSFQVNIVRVTATTINAVVSCIIGQAFADGAGTFSSTNILTRSFVSNGVVVSNLSNNAVVLRLLAEAVADNDVVQHTSVVSVALQ